jgi:hypothetical protein
MAFAARLILLLVLTIGFAFSEATIERDEQGRLVFVQDYFAQPSTLFETDNPDEVWTFGRPKQSFRCRVSGGYAMASKLEHGKTVLTWTETFAEGFLTFEIYEGFHSVSVSFDGQENNLNYTNGRFRKSVSEGEHTIVIELEGDDRLNQFEFNYLHFLASSKNVNRSGYHDDWETLYSIDDLEEAARDDTDKDGLTNDCEYRYGGNPLLADSDSDGMTDDYELSNGLLLDTKDELGDLDGDGLSNAVEFELKTQAHRSDTDNDRLSDFEEHTLHLTSPVESDTDGDGIWDGEEIKVHKTDPLDDDTDDDGFADYFEIRNETDPLDRRVFPSAKTGLFDSFELEIHSDLYGYRSFDYTTSGAIQGDYALKPKYDDQYLVYREVLVPSQFTLYVETNDGEVVIEINDVSETISSNQTFTFSAEVGAGLTEIYVRLKSRDAVEKPTIDAFHITPLDTDSDQLPDYWENRMGFDPSVADDLATDSDEDGLNNVTEYELGSDPFSNDTDGDQLPDYWEWANGTKVLEFDSDEDYDDDTFTNTEEYENDCDPLVFTDDGDYLPTEWERLYGTNPMIDDGDDDPDGDGFKNLREYHNQTHPRVFNPSESTTDDVNLAGDETQLEPQNSGSMPFITLFLSCLMLLRFKRNQA